MKTRTLLVTILLAAALILTACGSGQTPEPAAPAAPEPSATLPEPTAEPEAPTAEPTATHTAAALPSETPVEEPTVPAEPPGAAETGSGQQFTLVAEESEARFLIDEILLGAPKTVIGTTHAVTGVFMVDMSSVAASMLEVEVDLSTLVTDDEFRNRALHNNILHTSQPEFQFARFEGTAFENLPDAVVPGEPFAFQVRGDLTIHGVTKEALFEVTLTPVSETRFEGLAALTITYADYDVHILRMPPKVASVEDVTTLELAFVAEIE